MRSIKQKKGLTPVIAVILLLMMTVAAAGAAFFWFIRVQGELQGGEEQYAQTLAERVSAKMEVVAAEYRTGAAFKNITFIVKNTGNVPITVNNATTAPKATWILQDSDQKIICNEDWADAPSMCTIGCASTEIGVAATQQISLELSGACDISSETTYPNDTAFYFKLDFSGVTATGGSFKK